MAYLPNNWVDQNVERPKTYNFIQNDDGSTTLIDAFGNVTELGTPVNSDYMNHIEEGIAGCAVRKYSQTETYNSGEWVQGKTEEKQGLYESLTDNNLGNPLTDTNNWKKVELGGGSGGTAGHYIGELIYSPIPILNELGVTPSELHFADGGVVSSAEYEGFASRLDAVVALYPGLSKTEAEWQAVKAQYGEVNAFVIDKAAGTIRLPLIVNPIKGAGDLSQLGAIVEAGLPNIEGSWFPHRAYSPKGCVKLGTETMRDSSGATFDVTLNRYEIDASLSNPIYGKSDTVQPQQPFGCIYIVLATGMIQDYTALEEFAPVEAHSLLESKYSESILYNPAWLRSEGQWNAKGAYPSVFNALLAEHNPNIEAGAAVDFGYTKRGLAVKLSTEEYTDFDFVINTADETFRLPSGIKGQRVLVAKKVPTTADPTWFNLYSDGWLEQGGTSVGSETLNFIKAYKDSSYSLTALPVRMNANANSNDINYYDKTSDSIKIQLRYAGSTQSNFPYMWMAQGYTSPPQPYEYTENFLYYYVGNTVKNAQLIDAGRALERISEKLGRTDKTEITSWSLPDYTKGQSKNWNTAYQADKDGWLFCDSVTQNYSVPHIDFSFDGETWFQVWRGDQKDATTSACCVIPVTKGMYYKGLNGTPTTFTFYPAKGAD